ncbi:rhombosortase [Vibrio sp. ZSDZ34]|jgi:rhomboid family GlyGly-CTERM serine protease|uniref:Rhombosortase n=1 Tax=Vibrio gelatinilyticus TaxID=2893468 RepID=A0A9X1WA37_9VIBR|nr:rhombosortase [Vibrio gelatinilyticus]MCJ2375605.1 rhombosortase [Vibrio gelatinilyticus]
MICILAQLPLIQSWLVWDKTAINSGQWWRILTGNFSHTNSVHLIMNLAALWILVWIFRPRPNHFVFLLIFISSIIGLCLLSSSLGWYLGLSGALHGLFSYWALNEALRGRRTSWALVVAVIAKVAWEGVYGASEVTAQMIDASVATEAHFIGTIAGLATASVAKLMQR